MKVLNQKVDGNLRLQPQVTLNSKDELKLEDVYLGAQIIRSGKEELEVTM